MPQVISTTPITPETVITGAEFRDFYQNHWPSDWYVEEMHVEIEDEAGNYILPDDARHKLAAFGWAAWQGKGGAPNGDRSVTIAALYAEAMGKKNVELLVSFKIAPDKAEDLLKAAEALGARLI